jgi:hypothetical protein
MPNVERSFACQSCVASPLEHLADWVLKAMGVASAILFGIWAPVSYRLQDTSNKSSDESQKRLITKIDRLGEEMEDLKHQMYGLAVLRALEFCAAEERKVRYLQAFSISEKD